MKKIVIILLIAASCTTFFSCSKMLDTPSDGRMALKDIFSTYFRTKNYVGTCYNYMPQVGFSYDGGTTPLASFCDEAHDANDHQNGNVAFWYNGRTSASANPLISGAFDQWGFGFRGILRCNSFLQSIADPELATYKFNEEEKNGWIGQIHTLRAFYYLQLIKRYGGVPIMNTPYELAHDYTKDRRASFEECVDFIIADCDAALAIEEPKTETYGFRWDRSDEAQRRDMTRGVAYAIKSQAALYAASPLWSTPSTKYTWDKVAAITKEALDQCLAHGFKLYDTPLSKPTDAQNPYAYFFFTRSDVNRAWDKETILETTAMRSNVWKHAGVPITEAMIKAGPGPSQELVDAYETTNGETVLNLNKPYNDESHLSPNYNTANMLYNADKPYENRDPRFYASVYYNGAARYLDNQPATKVETYVGGNCGISDKVTDVRYTRTGYYFRKFNNWQSGISNDADGLMRIFRIGELYLNFAEAANMAAGPEVKISSTAAGQTPMSAKDAVDAIRGRVGMPPLPAGLSKEVFDERYRNERRVELAFEEHRFFDVRRWKILDQTDNFVTGMKIIKSANNSLSYNRIKLMVRGTGADKYLLFPLHRSEVAKMYQYTGVNWQNPGW